MSWIKQKGDENDDEDPRDYLGLLFFSNDHTDKAETRNSNCFSCSYSGMSD